MSEDSEYQRKHRPLGMALAAPAPPSSELGPIPADLTFLEPLTPWEPHRWPMYSEGGGRGPTMPLHVLSGWPLMSHCPSLPLSVTVHKIGR